MTARIVFSARAVEQLDHLDTWITRAASPVIAQRFIGEILAYIDGIALFPLVGRPRDDVREGLRTTTYRQRTVIAYSVVGNDGETVVRILGVFHGGQDWEYALRS